ncbi:MAG: IS200/IS605 family transposase [Ignavibacteriaceae bacterium]
MAGTYTQIYIHVIFAVFGRQNIIDPSWGKELHKYIAGIINGKNQKPIIVNGMPDHIHVFAGIKPSISISDLVRDIKNNSTNFINGKKYVPGQFLWQEGFGAFSYGHSQIESVYKYILNQQEHHKKRTFREEYEEILKKFEVQYKGTHLFKWIE